MVVALLCHSYKYIYEVTLKLDYKSIQLSQNTLKKWSKHKKPFISASEHARTVLSVFLNCMYLASFCLDLYQIIDF